MKKIIIAIISLGILVGCSSNSASTSNKAESGDIVRIDFVGKLDGTAFQGGTASNYDLELGSGNFIPGFEDQLIGMTVNEQKTITVTFPESYGETSLAGKKTTFDITLHKIYREVK